MNKIEVQLKEFREKEKVAIKIVGEKRNNLRRLPVRGYFTKKVVPNLLLGMRLIVVEINYLDNIVTFKLAE